MANFENKKNVSHFCLEDIIEKISKDILEMKKRDF